MDIEVHPAYRTLFEYEDAVALCEKEVAAIQSAFKDMCNSYHKMKSMGVKGDTLFDVQMQLAQAETALRRSQWQLVKMESNCRDLLRRASVCVKGRSHD